MGADGEPACHADAGLSRDARECLAPRWPWSIDHVGLVPIVHPWHTSAGSVAPYQNHGPPGAWGNAAPRFLRQYTTPTTDWRRENALAAQRGEQCPIAPPPASRNRHTTLPGPTAKVLLIEVLSGDALEHHGSRVPN